MPARFQLSKAKNGEFYFTLHASNGEVILTSEMYRAKSGAINGIESVKTNAGDDGRYERKTSSNGKPFFVLKAGNNQVIGQSEMYESEKARDGGIESVKKNGPTAQIADSTGA